jgi:glycosyltransferase involved in cell wall biosynthesis
VVANGIELGDPPPHPESQERARAIFLGSPMQAWHGVDKLAALARAFPSLDVDLVGYTPEQLAETVDDVPENLRVHGRLTRIEYEPLLAAADIGIGTLALHRKGMREAAPLKVREYLAAGLPVVIGYDDVDLEGVEPWWLLRLPNDEANVASAQGRIRAFVESVRGRRVPRAEVEPLISSRRKEETRLAFLTSIASTTR